MKNILLATALFSISLNAMGASDYYCMKLATDAHKASAIAYAAESLGDMSTANNMRRTNKTFTTVIKADCGYERVAKLSDSGKFPEHTKAMEMRDEIISSTRSEISSQLAIGRTSEKNKQYVVAIEAYTRVLQLDPDNVEARRAQSEMGSKLDISKELENLSMILMNFYWKFKENG